MKILLFYLIVLFFSKNIYSSSLYDTDFYKVEFESENINNEKIKQINLLKKITIENVLQKILLENDFKKIKRQLTIDTQNLFIKNIIIENEKIIKKKYISKIKIHLNKTELIKYLRALQVPYVEFLPKNFLLIIYEEDEISHKLFSKENSYYNYLLNNKKSFTNFIIPKLDINDRYILNKDDIINKDLDKLKKLAKKYNSDNFILIISTKIKNTKNYNIFFYSNQKFLEKKENNYNDLDLYEFFIILEKKSIENWKNLNYIQNIEKKLISCDIKYFNILELVEIKKILNNLSMVDNINLRSISVNNNKYDIFYYGNNKQLSTVAKMNNLIIEINDQVCSVNLK